MTESRSDFRALHQQIRFCTSSDGARIAYASVGEGPPLVKAPNWMTHLEYELESPVWRHWFEALSGSHTIIRFDQRGCGLSDRDVDISFDAWVADLEAVVEAAGLVRFPLLGISQGGAVAIEYAARHPERVSRLVLYGAFARGRLNRGVSQAEHEALVTLLREGWARDTPTYRQLFTSISIPSAEQEQMRAFNEMQRVSTTGEMAARTLLAGGNIDVTHRLPEIDVPTLVLHALGDLSCPFAEGRLLAASLRNARLVALDSPNHIVLADEPAWPVLLAELDAFLSSPETTSAAPAVPTSAAGVLSTREAEVLRLVVQGKSNQQIADELVISLNTVRRHVSNIFDKTGVANRAQAAVYGRDHGLV